MSINGVLLTETVFQPFINRVINTVMNKSVNKQMEQLFTRYPSLRGIGENLHRAYSILEKTFFNSGTLFVCGNGGSASDAEHIVGELMKNFLRKRPMPEGEKKIFREVLGPEDISSKLQMGFRAVCLNGAEDAMVKTPLAYKDGCMIIPDAPGIGVELADNAAELYPANERGSNAAKRAFDGSVKDW